MLNVITASAAIQALLAMIGALVCFSTPSERRAPYLPLGLLLAISSSTDIASFILVFGFRVNSNWVQNIYYLIAPVFLAGLFFRSTNARAGRLVVFAALLVPVFGLINLMFIQGWNTINSYTRAAGGFVVIILCLYYFYFLLQNLPMQKISQLPMFWINIGLLTYHSGTFVLFIFTDYLINVMKDNLLYYWGFHNLLGIIQFVFILTGLWKNRQTHNLA